MKSVDELRAVHAEKLAHLEGIKSAQATPKNDSAAVKEVEDKKDDTGNEIKTTDTDGQETVDDEK